MLPDRRIDTGQLGDNNAVKSMPKVRGSEKKIRNPFRCQECGALASKDGWCKKHRPKKRVNPLRDNFKPHNEYWGDQDNFGAVKSGFGAEKTWD